MAKSYVSAVDEYKASKKEKENLATIEQFTTVRRQNSSGGGGKEARAREKYEKELLACLFWRNI